MPRLSTTRALIPGARERLSSNLARCREVIDRAARRAGRDPSEVSIMAVTKYAPLEAVRWLHELGVSDFGENTVQGAGVKADTLGSTEKVRWHMIGHLQRNKVAPALRRFSSIHSVDSLRLIREIALRAKERGFPVPELFVEVNLSREASKTGFPEGEAREGLGVLREEPLLAPRVRGLMTMAPYASDPEQARPYFRHLRDLRESCIREGLLPETAGLSMGMSADLAIAVEEGATVVRVGSMLFEGLEVELVTSMPALRVESGPQANHVFLLRPPGPYRIGRDLEADFPLFDRRASRSHFRVDFCDDGYYLTDLDSKAGTFVNENRVKCAVLKSGDRIVAGKTSFSFTLDAADDPLLGRNLGGYRILERVGRGGMGTVYRARQMSLDRVVALKVLSGELSRDPGFSALFVREARAAGDLSHPNIVRVYDVNELDGILFYAMEFMAHGSVEDLLKSKGRLALAEALGIALQTALGLEYAEEKGIVHRDIKPANLMIHETGSVKIGDMGIATTTRGGGERSEQREAVRERGISGSPHYISPEQALGRDVDSRADIYSLGATIYELLAGVTPFHGQSVKEVLFSHIREEPPDLRRAVPDVPDSVAALVRSMLAKQPSLRPQSASSVRQSLEILIQEEARRPASKPLRVKSRWAPTALITVLAAGFLVLGMAIGLLIGHLGSVFTEQNVRLERIRGTISEGYRALGTGDIEGAQTKLREISNLSGSQEEWQILAPEIEKFERAVKGTSPRK